MSEPSAWPAGWSRYGAIIGGLAVGTAAKYGLSIGEGTPLSRRTMISDVLLLGFDGIIAVAICDWINAKGVMVVLTAALSAVASDRLVRLFRDRFVRTVDDEITKLSSVVKGPDVAVVPPGNEPPHQIRVVDPRSQSTAEVAVEHLQERPLPLRNDGLEDLIDRLDKLETPPDHHGDGI